MFVHKECGNPVGIKSDELINVIGLLTTDGKKLRVSQFQLVSKKNQCKPKFYCPNCEEDLDETELMFRCMHCGNAYDIEDVKIPKESNGTYCNRCYTRLFNDEPLIDIKEIMKAVQI